ncbi:MAG: YkgJ family cysteine cluster protein [Sulfolobales archaeon]
MSDGLRFKCYRCIHCCFFVSEEETPILLEDEVSILKLEAAKLNVDLIFTDLGNGLFRWVIRGFCPFYDIGNSSCTIHSKKPLSCKIYPLLLNLRTGDIHVSTACDWVVENSSKLLSSGDIDLEEVFKDELKWFKILYRKLLTT